MAAEFTGLSFTAWIFQCPTFLYRGWSRQLFTDFLVLIFQTCGLNPAQYKGHSFRIGAATLAAESGFSDAQIRLLGC